MTKQLELIDLRHPNYLHYLPKGMWGQGKSQRPYDIFATKDGTFIVHSAGRRPTKTVTVERITIGGSNEREINMGILSFLHQYLLWQSGELIQNAFPKLTADEREFLMTGITADRWEELFKGEQLP